MLINYKKMVYRNGFDFILENDVELYSKDWNGQVYINGYKNKIPVDKTYEPIVDIKGSSVKLIGFKEKTFEEIKNEFDELIKRKEKEIKAKHL